MGRKELFTRSKIAMPNFNEAIEHVLKWEGGYVNHPSDPGGATKFGITKKRYPALDIKNLTLSKAKKIYKSDFWDKFKIDNINSQDTATHYLDLTILHNNRDAAKMVQRALNDIGIKTTIDGIAGSNTFKNINRADQNKLNKAIGERRKSFFEFLIQRKPSLNEFRSGWIKRANYYINKSNTVKNTGIALSTVLIGIVAYKIIKPILSKKD